VPSFRGPLADSRNGASSWPCSTREIADQGRNDSKISLSTVGSNVALVAVSPVRNQIEC
jgi:hypothetical protein